MNHLRFLHYVDEVARVGSIRQAATRLHVAPSAVMRRVQDLESELGTAIFERLPRGMRLTAAGELFVRYIRLRSADLERVRSEIEELRGLRRGSLLLIASQALATSFLPGVIAAFHKSHALVEFRIRIGNQTQALDALRAFDADLAIVFNLPDEPDIKRVGTFAQKLCVIMHSSHPLASHTGPLRLKDCVDYPFVMPDRDVGGRQLIDRFLARRSIKLQPKIECDNFEFIRGYLFQTQALSIQISIGATTQDAQCVSKEICDPGFPTGELVMASLGGRQLPLVAHTFMEFFRDAFDRSVR
jgi:DNA-binding transcriptional LysR family regulator